MSCLFVHEYFDRVRELLNRDERVSGCQHSDKV